MPRTAGAAGGQYFDVGGVAVAEGFLCNLWGFAAFCQLQLCLHRAGKRFFQHGFRAMAADRVAVDVFPVQPVGKLRLYGRRH